MKRKKLVDYRRRDKILKGLGYLNYGDYLKSRLWFQVRHRLLKKYPYCCACESQATEVHHTEYTKANLSGLTTDGLFPIRRRASRRLSGPDIPTKELFSRDESKLCECAAVETTQKPLVNRRVNRPFHRKKYKKRSVTTRECSACGLKTKKEGWKFCPMCGGELPALITVSA